MREHRPLGRERQARIDPDIHARDHAVHVMDTVAADQPQDLAFALLPVPDQPAHEAAGVLDRRSEEHTSELQSLMRISYAVFCLKKKKTNIIANIEISIHHRKYEQI